MLTDSSLQASILPYIVDGIEWLEKDLAVEEPGLHDTIIHVLRIMQRVLEIQDIFPDLLLLSLASSTVASYCDSCVGVHPGR